MKRESNCHMSSLNRSNYVPLRNFGKALSPELRTDPIGWSIYRDVDAMFDEGSMSHVYGPASETSQNYMAQHCSQTWDGACELLSRNTDTTKPNVGLVHSPLFRHNEPGTMSIGDYLVLNSATRRFCNFDSCSITEEIYNPNDPTSPLVKKIEGGVSRPCLPVCTVPTNPDKDIVLNKVLQQPHKYMDLLVNMYHHCRNRNEIRDSRVEQIFKLFDTFYGKH